MKYFLFVVMLAFSTSTSLALNTQEQRWVDAVSNTYGTRAGKRVESWRNELSKYKSLSEQDKLTKVNNFFNQLHFVNDINLWGKNDYFEEATDARAREGLDALRDVAPSRNVR